VSDLAQLSGAGAKFRIRTWHLAHIEYGMHPRLVSSLNSSLVGAHAILAFMTARNEMLRLPATLDHYRSMGVDRFFIVDNASSDGTRDFLSKQRDVALFATEDSYAQSRFGMNWLHPLMDNFGEDHWIVNVDADELFIYPYYERITLTKLCQFLDGEKSNAVFSILLDMYSDRQIGATVYRQGESLIEACPYFDRGPYKIVRSPIFPYLELRGGPRARVFWEASTPFFHLQSAKFLLSNGSEVISTYRGSITWRESSPFPW
jgi:glycosyltransferase involved in cell wall biosynthesis